MASADSAPPEEGDGPSLSHQINASIVSSHTTLNRLILDRMPRAVPPHTDNPSAYITGLLHIGAVYVAFESLWQNLIGIHSEIAPIPYTFPFTSSSQEQQQQQQQQQQHDDAPPHCALTARTRRVLELAYSPTMLRAPRIKADVQAMTGWPDHLYAQQLEAAGSAARLGTFTRHIRDAVDAKPHVLLAYAYTLYLALLSGGSYIRTELLYLPREFWLATPAPVAPGMVECRPDSARWPRGSSEEDEHKEEEEEDDNDNDQGYGERLPLDFLDFDPPLGPNPRQQTKLIKADFKARFAAADALLTDPERRDIVAESAAIFHHLEDVVAQLDKLFVPTTTTTTTTTTTMRSIRNSRNTTPGKTSAQWARGTLGMRLRDSIAIAKGRLLLLRTRRKSGASSINTTAMMAASAEEENEHEHDPLARDAMVPREGAFRAIRYDDDDDDDNNKKKKNNNRNGSRSKDDNFASRVTRHYGFDGASEAAAASYCCPMSRRVPAVKHATGGPAHYYYAMYAIVSNLVLLGVVVGVFVAWLWVRHGDGHGYGYGYGYVEREGGVIASL